METINKIYASVIIIVISITVIKYYIKKKKTQSNRTVIGVIVNPRIEFKQKKDRCINFYYTGDIKFLTDSEITEENFVLFEILK